MTWADDLHDQMHSKAKAQWEANELVRIKAMTNAELISWATLSNDMIIKELAERFALETGAKDGT